MSLNLKSSQDGTKAIIGINGGEQLKVSSAGDLEIQGKVKSQTPGAPVVSDSPMVVDVNSSQPALRVTQTGTGEAIRLEGSPSIVAENEKNLSLGANGRDTDLVLLSSGPAYFNNSRIYMGTGDGAGNVGIYGYNPNYPNKTEWERSALGFHMGADGGVDRSWMSAASGTNNQTLLWVDKDGAYISKGTGGGYPESIVTKPDFTLYVDSQIGNDSYNGLTPTVVPASHPDDVGVNGPLKTIQRALEIAKLKSNSGFSGAGVTIKLAKGLYSDTTGRIIFSNNVSLVGESPLDFKAVNSNGLTITTNGATGLTNNNLQITIGGWDTGKLTDLINTGARYIHIYGTEGLDAHVCPGVFLSTRIGSPNLSSTADLYYTRSNGSRIGETAPHTELLWPGLGEPGFDYASVGADPRNYLLVGTQAFKVSTLTKDYSTAVATTNATRNSDADMAIVANTTNHNLSSSFFAGVLNDDPNTVFGDIIKVSDSSKIARGDLIFVNNHIASVVQVNTNTLQLDTSGCLLSSASCPFYPNFGNGSQVPFVVKSHHEQLQGSWRIVNVDVSTNTVTVSSDHLPSNSYWSRKCEYMALSGNWAGGAHAAHWTASLYDVPKNVTKILARALPTEIHKPNGDYLVNNGAQVKTRSIHFNQSKFISFDSDPHAYLPIGWVVERSSLLDVDDIAISGAWDGIRAADNSTITRQSQWIDYWNMTKPPIIMSGIFGSAVYLEQSSMNRIALVTNGTGYTTLAAYRNSVVTIPCARLMNGNVGGFIVTEGSHCQVGPAFLISPRIAICQTNSVFRTDASFYVHQQPKVGLQTFVTGAFKGGFNSRLPLTGNNENVWTGASGTLHPVVAPSIELYENSNVVFGSFYMIRTGALGCTMQEEGNSEAKLHRVAFCGGGITDINGATPYLLNKFVPFQYPIYALRAHMDLYQCTFTNYHGRPNLFHVTCNAFVRRCGFVNNFCGFELGWGSKLTAHTSLVFNVHKWEGRNARRDVIMPSHWTPNVFSFAGNDSSLDVSDPLLIFMNSANKTTDNIWVAYVNKYGIYSNNNTVTISETNSTFQWNEIANVSNVDTEFVFNHLTGTFALSSDDFWKDVDNNVMYITVQH